MLFVTAVLLFLLASGLFLAARELSGFEPEEDWQDVARLRERLSSQLPPAPHHLETKRTRTIAYCLTLKREFRSAWRLCRFLAPITGDPGYVWTLVAVKVRFHVILAGALVCATTGLGASCNRRMDELRELSAAMRAGALAILLQSDLEHGFNPV